MSILVNKNTRVVVQGITGKEGSFHATQCKAYGTKVVAGVTPGKAGQEVDGIPVFNTVADAVKKTEADTSLIFVPPGFCADAIQRRRDDLVEVRRQPPFDLGTGRDPLQAGTLLGGIQI